MLQDSFVQNTIVSRRKVLEVTDKLVVGVLLRLQPAACECEIMESGKLKE